ncbi:tRNA (adenosine(37)-N6)-threonylcarbamoyltransferase complex ATPase subunit type 1 TsaE [Spirosoma koreense]
MYQVQFIAPDVQSTNQIAETLSRVLEFGDVILLQGELGAGKTHFVKACLQALHYGHGVASPTFTIANFYDISDGFVIHADLYRVKTVAEFTELGLEDFFDRSITFIEWGDKFADYFDDCLTIGFDYLDGNLNARKISFSAASTSWVSRLHKIQAIFQQSDLSV